MLHVFRLLEALLWHQTLVPQKVWNLQLDCLLETQRCGLSCSWHVVTEYSYTDAKTADNAVVFSTMMWHADSGCH